jgi:DNA-directed RNA polymerase subunit RPC12/RpoP
MSERIDCPACGKRVLIRQNGAIQNHRIRRFRRSHRMLQECPRSGVICVRRATAGESDGR